MNKQELAKRLGLQDPKQRQEEALRNSGRTTATMLDALATASNGHKVVFVSGELGPQLARKMFCDMAEEAKIMDALDNIKVVRSDFNERACRDEIFYDHTHRRR